MEWHEVDNETGGGWEVGMSEDNYRLMDNEDRLLIDKKPVNKGVSSLLILRWRLFLFNLEADC